MKHHMKRFLALGAALATLLTATPAEAFQFTVHWRGNPITCWDTNDWTYNRTFGQRGLWVVSVTPPYLAETPTFLLGWDWVAVGECRSTTLGLDFTLIHHRASNTLMLVEPRHR